MFDRAWLALLALLIGATIRCQLLVGVFENCLLLCTPLLPRLNVGLCVARFTRFTCRSDDALPVTYRCFCAILTAALLLCAPEVDLLQPVWVCGYVCFLGVCV